jgi:hypothetical protein
MNSRNKGNLKAMGKGKRSFGQVKHDLKHLMKEFWIQASPEKWRERLLKARKN